MLNWIAIWVGVVPVQPRRAAAEHDRRRTCRSPTTSSTSAKLPVFWGDPELQGLHVGLFIALAALLVFWVILNRTTLGYEVRAVGFNPDAAAAAGISVRRNYILVMAICGAVRRPRRHARRARLAVPDRHQRHPGQRSSASSASRSRCSGATRRSASALSALLFGALITGTSVRNLDPTVFEPALATNLTCIIQGLVVLFVSTDVLVVYLWRLRRRSRSRPSGGGGMSARRDACAPAVGWAGIALGLLAFFIAVPPILVRSPVPVVMLGAGGDRVRAPGRRRRREARSAGARSSPACVGMAGGIAATSSGETNLERGRRLGRAAGRDAALRDAADLRRARRPVLRALAASSTSRSRA